MSEVVTNSGMELLKTNLGENSKARHLLDGQLRVQFLIVAAANAKHGASAHRTEYVYLNPTSTLIVAWKETNTTWDSAWDADFTT